MRAFHPPREHGGWTMWVAAVLAGAVHALAHHVPASRAGDLALALIVLYLAGDWAQSAVAAAFHLPFRGQSDTRSLVGPMLIFVGGGLLLAVAPQGNRVEFMSWVILPAVAATWLRAKRQPFDHVLLVVSSFALAGPAMLYAMLAAPGCLQCALRFWSLPAIGYPLLTILIRSRMPAPPATVRRLGWSSAAVTVVLAACWVAWWWPAG